MLRLESGIRVVLSMTCSTTCWSTLEKQGARVPFRWLLQKRLGHRQQIVVGRAPNTPASGSYCSNTNVAHLLRFSPYVGGPVAPDIVVKKEPVGDDDDEDDEATAPGYKIVNDKLYYAKVTQLLKDAKDNVLVEADVKIAVIQTTSKPGHHLWARIRKKLVNMGVIESIRAKVGGKAVACLRLLRQYTDGEGEGEESSGSDGEESASVVVAEQTLEQQVFIAIEKAGPTGMYNPEIWTMFGIDQRLGYDIVKKLLASFGVVAVAESVKKQIQYRLLGPSYAGAKQNDMLVSALEVRSHMEKLKGGGGEQGDDKGNASPSPRQQPSTPSSASASSSAIKKLKGPKTSAASKQGEATTPVKALATPQPSSSTPVSTTKSKNTPSKAEEPKVKVDSTGEDTPTKKKREGGTKSITVGAASSPASTAEPEAAAAAAAASTTTSKRAASSKKAKPQSTSSDAKAPAAKTHPPDTGTYTNTNTNEEIPSAAPGTTPVLHPLPRKEAKAGTVEASTPTPKPSKKRPRSTSSSTPTSTSTSAPAPTPTPTSTSSTPTPVSTATPRDSKDKGKGKGKATPVLHTALSRTAGPSVDPATVHQIGPKSTASQVATTPVPVPDIASHAPASAPAASPAPVLVKESPKRGRGKSQQHKLTAGPEPPLEPTPSAKSGDTPPVDVDGTEKTKGRGRKKAKTLPLTPHAHAVADALTDNPTPAPAPAPAPASPRP
mmetsp:Transcript_2583/g.4570  ORF Transcript_2583/g.4570 Transcript_2583/m.4570 type:complete len:719 (+) Transcript_2583:368-2524(+)